ncbi:MAG: aldehyde dehydrogenase family protein, partial [Brevibacterium aurantiacum]|nr:aldehyde dehydrogenase family protein [Brevibacterium aurantiacum]
MSTDLTTFAGLLSSVDDPNGRELLDPATGEVVGRTREGSPADIDTAVAAARKVQSDWAARTSTERSDLLNKAADAVEASAEALAELLSREQGKPLNGPNARFEVGACAAWLRANAAFELEPEVLVDDEETHAELHYAPVGVVGAVGPWNWPMMISVWQFAPSLKMGNTVVLKPSEYTPLSVQAL